MDQNKFKISMNNHNKVTPLINNKDINKIINNINWFSIFPNFLDIQSNAIKYAKIARQEVQNRKNGSITSEATMRKKVDALFWHGILGYSSIGKHFNLIGEKTSNISEKRADFIIGKYNEGDDTKSGKDLNTKGVVEIEDSSYNFNINDTKDGVIQAFNYAPLYRWYNDLPRYVIATNFILFRIYYNDIYHAESFDLTKLYNENELKKLLLFMSPHFFLQDNNKIQRTIHINKSHKINNKVDPNRQANLIYRNISDILKFEKSVNDTNIFTDKAGYTLNYVYINTLMNLTNVCDKKGIYNGQECSVNNEITNWKFGYLCLPLLEQKAHQLKQKFTDLDNEIREYCRECGNLEPTYELAEDPISGTGALRQARILARPCNKYFKQYQHDSAILTNLKFVCQHTYHKYSVILANNSYGLFINDLSIDTFISWIAQPTSLKDMKQCWHVINNNPTQVKLNKAILDYAHADKSHKKSLKSKIYNILQIKSPIYKKQTETNKSYKCPKCGTINPVTAEFCRHCGYKLHQGMKKVKELNKSNNNISKTQPHQPSHFNKEISDNKKLKKCPDCNRMNKATAKTCWYCGYNFITNKPKDYAQEQAKKAEHRAKSDPNRGSMGCMYVIIVVIIVTILLGLGFV